MHDGHLSTDPDCPCPSPRGREIVEPLNYFMNEARALGLPIIHVRSTLRKGGADEKNCFRLRGAWCFRLRSVRFPTSQSTPSKAHAEQNVHRCTRRGLHGDDQKAPERVLSDRSGAAAAQPGIRRVVLTGCMTDCCVINTAFDAANRDFRVVVPRDLTRGSEHLEEPALRTPSRCIWDLSWIRMRCSMSGASGLNAYLKLHINKKTR